MYSIYIKPEINNTTHLYTIKVKKSQSHRPARLRGYRKLPQHQLCEETRVTNMKTHLQEKTLQHRWNTEQSGDAKILCGCIHKDRKQEKLPMILPYRPRGKSDNTQIPMVRQCPT